MQSDLKSNSTIRSSRFERTQSKRDGVKSRSINSDCSPLSKFHIKNLLLIESLPKAYRAVCSDKQLKSPKETGIRKSKIQYPLTTKKPLIETYNFQKHVRNISNDLNNQIRNILLIKGNFQNQILINRRTIMLLIDKIDELNNDNQQLYLSNTKLTKTVGQHWQTILNFSNNKAPSHKVNLTSQHKMKQLTQQNNKLKIQINDLQKTIAQRTFNDKASYNVTASIISQQTDKDNSLSQETNFDESTTLQVLDFQDTICKLQQQLQGSRKQILRLHLYYNTELRKIAKQSQLITQRREFQYSKLKTKFLQYLNKYNKSQNNTKPKDNHCIRAKALLVQKKANCFIKQEQKSEALDLSLTISELSI